MRNHQFPFFLSNRNFSWEVNELTSKELNKERSKELKEHDSKAALRKEISLELEKLCYVLASNMQPRDLESHALPFRPRTLNNQQTLVTNKSATNANILPMQKQQK